jgi:hypothetical protein
LRAFVGIDKVQGNCDVRMRKKFIHVEKRKLEKHKKVKKEYTKNQNLVELLALHPGRCSPGEKRLSFIPKNCNKVFYVRVSI